MDTQKLGDVSLQLKNGVAVLTLDRAPFNTIDIVTALALTDFFRAASEDKSVRSILITGAGRRFCTGADISDTSAIDRYSTVDYRFGHETYTRMHQALWEIEVPVVSAVNGTVAGVGWMLALLADIVVAAENARWTHVFTRRGMVPHAGDAYFLSRIIPFHRMSEIALLSEPILSTTLLEWNIINRAVADEELLPTAMELATRLASGPTTTFGVTKQLYRRALDSSMPVAFADERSAVALVSTTHDRKEGLTSFVDNRVPDFTGV